METSLLRFDLWMSGCYLWTIAPSTERFFTKKLTDAGVRGKPLDQALSECFCTALGGANAYLDRYCQFENVQTQGVAGRKSPLLIAFCYNQKAAVRNYDFYLLSTVREEMEDAVGTEEAGEEGQQPSILRAYLSKLPDSYSLRIADGETKGGALHSVKVTDASGKTTIREVPRANQDDVKLVGELESRLTDALRRMKSPAAAWRSVQEIDGFQEIFAHIPRSVQDSVQLSYSAKEAIAVLHGATCHPADAPVLMEIYAQRKRELSKAGDGKAAFERFQAAIAKADEDDRTEPGDRDPAIPADLMPRSVMLGRVCEIESKDEISVEFEVPSGERFVETFDRSRLKAVKADYYGAQVKYLLYEKGSWRFSRFALRGARSVAARSL